MNWPWFLALLAEACGKAGQIDEGLRTLDEALAVVQNNEEHLYEAEVYRLKGELLLQQSGHIADYEAERLGQVVAGRCVHKAQEMVAAIARMLQEA